MGKHAKPKVDYRAALLLGAAPVAMLLASPGIGSAAETFHLGGLQVTPDHDRGHQVSHSNGITTYRDFVSGYLDAMNHNAKSMPLGTDGAAGYADRQHDVSSGSAGSTTASGHGALGNEMYAKGHRAGSADLVANLHRGDYGLAGTDSTTHSGDLSGTRSTAYGPHGLLASDGSTARGAGTHAGGMTGDLGSGRSASMTDAQSMTGLLSGTTHGALDPRSGAGAMGGSNDGRMGGANALGGTMDLGDGATAGANSAQRMIGSLDGSRNLAMSKHGLVAGNTVHNAMGAANAVGAHGSAGPVHGVLANEQGGTISGLVDTSGAGTPEGSGASSHSGTISGVFDSGNEGGFGIDHLVDGTVATHRKGAMNGTMSGAAGIDPNNLAGSSAAMTSSHGMAMAGDTAGALTVIDLVHVSGAERTSLTQRGTEAVSENDISNPVEHGNLTHANNLRVQLADSKPVGGGVELSESPLAVHPHAETPLGRVDPGNLTPGDLSDVTRKVGDVTNRLGDLDPSDLHLGQLG